MTPSIDPPALIFWTCATLEEARKVSRLLLSEKLVACASLLPGVESLFEWKGVQESAQETKVILKSFASYFPQVLALIQKHATYEVSEVNLVLIEKANLDYVDWMRSTLK